MGGRLGRRILGTHLKDSVGINRKRNFDSDLPARPRRQFLEREVTQRYVCIELVVFPLANAKHNTILIVI